MGDGAKPKTFNANLIKKHEVIKLQLNLREKGKAQIGNLWDHCNIGVHCVFKLYTIEFIIIIAQPKNMDTLRTPEKTIHFLSDNVFFNGSILIT